MDVINKKFGEGTIVPLSKAKGLKVRKFSSGSLALDLELAGGIPYTRIIESAGHESSSKTTGSLAAAREFLHANTDHEVVFFDEEHALDLEWANLVMGAEYATRMHIASSETGEQSAGKIKELIFARIPVLVIVDSIASMTPEAEIDKEFEKGIMGNHAKFINRFLRVATAGMWKNLLKETNDSASLYLINQNRQSMALWGDNTVQPGGKGLKFHASVRLALRRAEFIEDDGDAEHKKRVGIKVAFKVPKSKVSPQETSGTYDLYYRDYGRCRKGVIDNTEAAWRYGLLVGVIKASKRSYEYRKLRAVGNEAFLHKLQENVPVLVDLIDEIAEKCGIVNYDAASKAYIQALGKSKTGKAGGKKNRWSRSTR